MEGILGKRRMGQGEGQKAKESITNEGGSHLRKTSEVHEGLIPLRTEGWSYCDHPTIMSR